MKLEFPGFIDVHVHFRDPGMPEAETTTSGLKAAAHGGFHTVVVMPNTTPPIDTSERVRKQFSLAAAVGSSTRLLPSATITAGRLGHAVADLEATCEAGAAFFTDDGAYVLDDMVMEIAMRRAHELNMVVSQHALAPNVTEEMAIRRDLSLCRVTGCRLHIQHLSTASGVELVRMAQREGLPVTAEATPHHLLLTRDDIIGPFPGNFKMAPPLAGKEDRAELRRAVKDGVLMFATDHAPHPAANKFVAYEKAANGIIGLETAIPITYHVMVEEEGMSVDDWAMGWWKLPRSILHGEIEDFGKTMVELDAPRKVKVNEFLSLSRNCPYDGMEFNCWPIGG